ncbi:MAG: hypothetical protein H6Q10_2789 [Acidobacteria bacterium]|nr:hypothetical protein [Acidobacteriota bacterium]
MARAAEGIALSAGTPAPGRVLEAEDLSQLFGVTDPSPAARHGV